MNKVPHLNKISKDNNLNQNCIIINPIQVFERKKILNTMKKKYQIWHKI